MSEDRDHDRDRYGHDDDTDRGYSPWDKTAEPVDPPRDKSGMSPPIREDRSDER